jgi:hypothetical protein
VFHGSFNGVADGQWYAGNGFIGCLVIRFRRFGECVCFGVRRERHPVGAELASELNGKSMQIIADDVVEVQLNVQLRIEDQVGRIVPERRQPQWFPSWSGVTRPVLKQE